MLDRGDEGRVDPRMVFVVFNTLRLTSLREKLTQNVQIITSYSTFHLTKSDDDTTTNTTNTTNTTTNKGSIEGHGSINDDSITMMDNTSSLDTFSSTTQTTTQKDPSPHILSEAEKYNLQTHKTHLCFSSIYSLTLLMNEALGYFNDACLSDDEIISLLNSLFTARGFSFMEEWKSIPRSKDELLMENRENTLASLSTMSVDRGPAHLPFSSTIHTSSSMYSLLFHVSSYLPKLTRPLKPLPFFHNLVSKPYESEEDDTNNSHEHDHKHEDDNQKEGEEEGRGGEEGEEEQQEQQQQQQQQHQQHKIPPEEYKQVPYLDMDVDISRILQHPILFRWTNGSTK